MSDDNLESLDNVSLRKKCLEYGLPNVPITDTSRKLLIRKLRAAINGETDDKKKNRRETIHVTKIPAKVPETNSKAAEEEAPKRPPSRINRRTIAATSVTSTTADESALSSTTESNKPQIIADRRRSVRASIDNEAPQPVIPISQKRKNNVLIELESEENDDDDDVILLEAAEASEKEIVIPRTRRSVSLTKTGVVTTSYSQESVSTKTSPPTVNETESESEYDYRSTKYSGPIYEPSSIIGKPLSQTQPISTSYGFSEPIASSFRTSTINRTSIDPEPIYNKPTIPSAATSRYSHFGSGYPGYPTLSSSSTINNSSTTTTTRRYTSSSANLPSAKYSDSFDDQNENDENQPATPYLSDFARKLERLKAEPLSKGIGAVDATRNTPMKRDTQRFHHTSISGRRSTRPSDSVSDSFKNFVFALDRKYKLKRNFSILFVIILILFIYVVFIN